MNCLLVVLLVSACKSTAETGEPDETIQPLMSESQMPAPDDEPRSTEEDGELGTVRYLELEGGFYGIVIDSGAKYLPLNLDEAFQQDSMRVRVKVRPPQRRNDYRHVGATCRCCPDQESRRLTRLVIAS